MSTCVLATGAYAAVKKRAQTGCVRSVPHTGASKQKAVVAGKRVGSAGAREQLQGCEESDKGKALRAAVVCQVF